jgi:hypothetical protein
MLGEFMWRWRFEPRQPQVKLVLLDTEASSRQVGIAPPQSRPEFVTRNIEVQQFDPCSKRMTPGAILIALGAAPEPVFQHHVQPKRQRAARDISLQRFDTAAQTIECVGPDRPTERDQPLVWTQTERWHVALQLSSQGRLTCTG